MDPGLSPGEHLKALGMDHYVRCLKLLSVICQSGSLLSKQAWMDGYHNRQV